jgi:outer membrane protein
LASLAAAPRAQAELELQTGWAYLRPAGVASTFRTRVRESPATVAFGIPASFESPQVGVTPQAASTLTLSAAWWVSPRWALRLDLGIPPEVAAEGSGIAAPPGPAGALFRLDLGDPAINPLATQRQWSPIVAAQYRFGGDGARLRPFLGAGVTYTWFTAIEIGDAFERALDARFGQPLAIGAGKPGPTSVSLDIDPLWAPAFAAGVGARLHGPWRLTAALGYTPFQVLGALELRAADGTVLSRTRARLELDGVAAGLALGYVFGAARDDQ